MDSSPVDYRTRKSDPVTPVTTPSRGASPTFPKGSARDHQRLPYTEWCHGAGTSDQGIPTPFARKRFWRLLLSARN